MDKKIILIRIDELMKEKGITYYQLKEETGISTTIYQWKKNATRDKDRIPSLRSIEKICDYFGVSLSYFFAFDKDSQNEVEIEELVKEFRNISGEQRKLIKSLIRQFK